MQKPKSISEYIDLSEYPEILRRLRTLLLETELEEKIKWNFPCYCWKNKNVIGLGSFKSYAGIWFYQGVFMADEVGKLVNAQEGKTKGMRQWRFTNMNELDDDLIRAYLHEAIENQKAGLEVKPERSTKELLIPQLLQAKLTEDPSLSMQFEGFSPYKQKEFVEYIVEAKQEKTKLRRLEKILPMIKDGIGLGDKYRK